MKSISQSRPAVLHLSVTEASSSHSQIIDQTSSPPLLVSLSFITNVK